LDPFYQGTKFFLVLFNIVCIPNWNWLIHFTSNWIFM
jgi:hypothetical protein